jgi:hypothetical protein
MDGSSCDDLIAYDVMEEDDPLNITGLGMCTSEYSADVPGTALEYTTAF